MKYKKYSYLLIFILMLVLGVNNVHAGTGVFGTAGDEEKICYYMNSDGTFKTRLNIHWHLVTEYNSFWDYINPLHGAIEGFENMNPNGFTKVTVDKVGDGNYAYDSEYIVNWFYSLVYVTRECIDNNVCFGWRYSTVWDANGDFNGYAEPSCPNHLVFQDDGTYYWLWATDSESKAQEGVDYIKSQGRTGYYGSLTTSDKYFQEWVDAGLVKYDKDEDVNCTTYETIFGSKDDPNSIRYLVNEVLLYVRIIVPVLIIVLGMVDFGKAVLANKEDTMKKAQTDFAKRVLIGVAVFFVPALVDIIMEFADILWSSSEGGVLTGLPICPL